MSSDTILELPNAFVSYPSEGVTVSINYHPQTLGRHRLRLHFDRAVADALRRGLAFPRVHVDGSVINGLRVWCTESGGLAPNSHKSGAWSVMLPVRRLRGREGPVSSTPAAIEWERDDTGPVLLLPRLPDALLPEAVVVKLPNSQVDPETRFDRADKKLQREIAILNGQDSRETITAPAVLALGSGKPDRSLDAMIETIGEPPAPEPPAPPAPEPPAPPPSNDAADLKTALAMVNELVERLGDSVALSIDADGRVQAKRRVVSFIDL